MNIVDLPKELESSYFYCLEDWSDEMKESGDHKANWYAKFKDRGLRVKIALNDEGVGVGMIQYLPIEESHVSGKNLYFILCIWVHGYDEGQGNYQKQGIGTDLLEHAEEDAKSLGAKGMVAWGLTIPVFMRASWFKKKGYMKVDKMNMQALVWKPFTEDAVPPKWIRQQKKLEKIPGKVRVTSFINGWCPAQSLVSERAKKVAKQFGDKVVFEEIDTSEKETFLEWGITDALYIDDKNARSGPPLTIEKITKKIAKKVKKL